MKKLWSPLEIDFLTKNYSIGSPEFLEKSLGRPWHGIKLKAFKLGLSKHIPISQEVLDDYNKGMPLKELLKKHNVATTSLYRELKENNLRRNHPALEINLEEFTSDYKTLTIEALESKYTMNYSSLKAVASRHKIKRTDSLIPRKETAITVEQLKTEYIDNNLSFGQISSKYYNGYNGNISNLGRLAKRNNIIKAPSVIREQTRKTCIEKYGQYPVSSYGKAQGEVQTWLNSFGFNFQSDYTILENKEIDLYDPTLKLGIEYNGLRWHCELHQEDKHYHNNKRLTCESKGIRLITIFEDEWIFREQQCKNFLKSVLHKNFINLYARKCTVKLIEKSTGQVFIEEHHIQGTNHLGLHFAGLFHNEELIGVLSFGRHHRIQGQLTLDRLCFKSDISVTGGSSKLLKFLLNEIKPSSLISWSDNRWSQGKVYEQLGFKLEEELSPDYSYVDLNSIYKRVSKQSQKNKPEDDPNLTEHERCLEKGLFRIWDCGKKRWVLDYKL